MEKQGAQLIENDGKNSIIFTNGFRLITQEPIYNEPAIIFGIYANKNENLKFYGGNERKRHLHGTYEQQYFHGMEFFDLKVEKKSGNYGDINEKITVTLTLSSKALSDKYLTPEDGYRNLINDYSTHVQFVGVNVVRL